MDAIHLLWSFCEFKSRLIDTNGTRTRATQMLTYKFVEISTPLTTAPWRPVCITAVCINLSISPFSHYIHESENTTKFLTDSKACVQAYEKGDLVHGFLSF